jgi:hypothetical protein
MAINHDRVRGDGHLFRTVGNGKQRTFLHIPPPFPSKWVNILPQLHLADQREVMDLYRCIFRERKVEEDPPDVL